jgi:hypothetical protein
MNVTLGATHLTASFGGIPQNFGCLLLNVTTHSAFWCIILGLVLSDMQNSTCRSLHLRKF